MKHFKQFLLAVLVALTSSLNASAYDFEVNGIYYNATSRENLTCEVTFKDNNYKSYSGDIVIPSSVTYSGRTFSVTSIGESAFYDCSSLTSVTIPNSVTLIGGGAFASTSLTSIEIPNSVTSIGGGAFASTSLTSIEIPNSVTSIGGYAFKFCYSLTSVVIPNSVTSIGEYVFYRCSNLESVVIGNSVTSIGEYAFYRCSSLESVMIGNSVTSIGAYAFERCPKLTSVVIPNSVTKIGDKAFRDCQSLASLTIGNSVTEIGEQAFRGCTSLASVVIPNSVTEIGRTAFFDCYSLASVVIGNSVTSIRMETFAYCTSLASVVIPNSVTEIGWKAFEGCSNLTTAKIPNSVTTIDGCAFDCCSSLTSVVIPNSITSIGTRTFYGCSSLTSVVIPNSVTSIGSDTFEGCTSLKEITSLAVTPPRISDNTFKGVSKTESVVKVPAESVTTYQAAEYWKEFWNIVGLNGEGGDGSDTEPETKQCAAPTLELVNGRLVAKSATEGAKCHTSITSDDKKGVTGNKPIELTGVYNLSSYAHADGYQNSETVTATLVWVNPTLEDSGVMSMEAKKAVLIRTQGGSIIVSGTERGEGIQLYSADGRQLCSVLAEDGQTVIPCNAGKGEVVILKMGQKTVEVAM